MAIYGSVLTPRHQKIPRLTRPCNLIPESRKMSIFRHLLKCGTKKGQRERRQKSIHKGLGERLTLKLRQLFVNSHSLSDLNQFLLLLLILQFLESARWVVVQDDQVPVTHVETRQVIARILRIMNILNDVIMMS